MKPSTRPAALAALLALLAAPSTTLAQTYSSCNPTQQSCPADPALGTSADTDFTSGASSQYTATGDSISYDSNGGQFSVAASGNNPTLTSDFYIMFGHVDFVFKAAPGVGMVSSAILLSDTLDEIDWEILGYQSTQAQTNYFSKGQTGTVDPGELVSVPTSQTDYNTYSIDWTAETLVWSVNGAAVRTLTYAESGGVYPQTPMRVKIGSWAGGDSTNSPGTIQWAGGPIDYSQGPFVMGVRSISVQDYSTGTEYQYTGTSGTWQSITAVGGTVGADGPADSSGSGSGGQSSAVTTGTLASSTLSASASSSASSRSRSSASSTLVTVVTTSLLPAPLPLVSSVGSSSLGTGLSTMTMATTTTPGSTGTTGTGTTSAPTGTSTVIPFDPNGAPRSGLNGALMAGLACLTTAFMMCLL